MTTEAEEFKKQHERFNELKDKFIKIWQINPNEIFDYEYYHSHDGYSYRIEFGLIDLFETDEFHQRQSFALRALNDRLELALQGKVKGE